MTALIRYVTVDSWRSLRWVAPVLVFFVSQALFDAETGSVLPTYAGSTAVLFFIATWLTVVVSNSEDPVQEEVTISAAGGRLRVRLAKLATAYLYCAVLIVMALAVPPAVSGARTTPYEVASGAAAQAITVLAGVAVGALCSRPIINRTAFSVLLGVMVGLGDLIIPDAPPVHQLVKLLDEVKPRHLGFLIAGIAVETIALSTIFVGTSLRLARLKS